MKLHLQKLTLILLAPFLAFAGKDYKYDFKTVPNDPFNVLQYELDNGLKIYLSVNEDEPRVYTNIAVRTGSKNDPSEVTGLAHYLEHMLFKGTSKIGSLNWEKEKVLLRQISDLYEKHRKTTDPEKRKEIYAEIDRLSGEAAKYVATNEYDQMVQELGARGTNAYTSLERTVYINDIPANEMEKWMMIESERFNELVLRLFHTELEAVYEEYNRGQDSDGRQAYFARMEALFPNHTYGTQTTLGTSEHLKNPSMEKIHEYFKTYYVPNNMAIIMAGDLDPDQTVDLLKKYFGSWKKGPEPPQYKDPGQPEISTPIIKEVSGSEAAFINIAYRLKGIGSKDELMVDLASSVLSNGKAGFIDKNLNQQQKVIRAYAYSSSMKDYSTMVMGATPRAGQSLEEVKQLLLEQVKHLKDGDFDNGLINSIVRNARKSQMRQAEINSWKSRAMINGFIYDIPWSHFANYYDRMQEISKEDLVKWANENLADNYVAVMKIKGERTPPSIEKPAITPVAINRGTSSEFRNKLEDLESGRLEPHFIDFENDIRKKAVKNGIDMYYVPNTTNELFSLNYIFDMGSRNDKKLALAIQYLPYLGTANSSVEEVKRKFYDLALDYSVYAGEDRVYVTLSGLGETMNEGVRLFEELLAQVSPNPEAYNKFVDGIIKKRMDDKSSKNKILYNALYKYAIYGENSPLLDQYSEAELRAIDPNELVQKIKDLSNYKHKVFYYGPADISRVSDIVEKNHRAGEDLMDYPERKQYTMQDNETNKVYYVDYDQVQAEILLLSKTQKFNSGVMAPASVFNQYFGSGLSSIVFQEIRESKALAYSAYSVFTSPSRDDEYHFVQAYIGTQSDKLGNAVAAMQELMNEMPLEESNFNQAKIGALKQFESNPTTKASIYWSYQNALDRGLSQNPRPDMYNTIRSMSLADVEAFFNENIKGRKYAYLVIGKRENMDMSALAQLGEVQEVKLEEIFGY